MQPPIGPHIVLFPEPENKHLLLRIPPGPGGDLETGQNPPRSASCLLEELEFRSQSYGPENSDSGAEKTLPQSEIEIMEGKMALAD